MACDWHTDCCLFSFSPGRGFCCDFCCGFLRRCGRFLSPCGSLLGWRIGRWSFKVGPLEVNVHRHRVYRTLVGVSFIPSLSFSLIQIDLVSQVSRCKWSRASLWSCNFCLLDAVRHIPDRVFLSPCQPAKTALISCGNYSLITLLTISSRSSSSNSPPLV